MDEVEYLERRLGSTLRGKWTLERLLGWGGMAAVYVGAHSIGRRDAIKILHAEVAVAPEHRARFEQEAYAVNHLQHQGAVQIRDIDVTDDGCPFLVMELLEGESLATALDRPEPFDRDSMLRMVHDVLDVLSCAHASGIIHRDIKPDNLFLCTDGRVKVLDFGVARMKEGTPKTLKTRTGMAVGTLTYMAPEQVLGRDVDHRVDLFAVGATMFRCVARRRIHDGTTEADMIIKMATQPAPRLSSVAPDAPPELCMVVDTALAFEARHRYPDAATMQADVAALMRGEQPPFAVAAFAKLPTAPAHDPAPASGSRAGSYEAPTRADIPPPAAVLQSPASAAVPAITATIDATAVEAVVPASVPQAPASRKGAVVIAVVVGAAFLLFAVLVFAAVVGWWWLGTQDDATAEVTTSNPEASGAEVTGTGAPATVVASATTTAGSPPGTTAGKPPPLRTAPPATTTVPPTTTIVPPARTAVPPATTTAAPPATTTAAPPATTTAAPPATAPPGGKKDKDDKHKKDKKKDGR